MHPSVVCRDRQWIRDSSCPGESPDVQEACFIQIERMKFKGGTAAVRPQTPAVGNNNESRGGGRILEKMEDLRPAGRCIRPPTEVVIRLAHLCTSQHMPEHFLHMPEHAQTCLYKPAHACTTEELPSQKRKPLCDRYLGRWISPSFPFRDGGTRETRGRGDAGTRRRGDAETRGRRDAGTRRFARNASGRN